MTQYDPLEEERKRKRITGPEGFVEAGKPGEFEIQRPPTAQSTGEGSFAKFAGEEKEFEQDIVESARGEEQRRSRLEAEATVDWTVPQTRQLPPEEYKGLVKLEQEKTTQLTEAEAYHAAQAKVATIKAEARAMKEADYEERWVAEAKLKAHGVKPKGFSEEDVRNLLKQRRQKAEALATKQKLTHPTGTNVVWKRDWRGNITDYRYKKSEDSRGEAKTQEPPFAARLGLYEGKQSVDATLVNDPNASPLYKEQVSQFERNLPEAMVGKEINSKKDLQDVIESVPGYGAGIQGSAVKAAEEYLMKTDPKKYVNLLGRQALGEADASIVAGFARQKYPEEYTGMSDKEAKKKFLANPKHRGEYATEYGQRAAFTIGKKGQVEMTVRRMMPEGITPLDTTGLPPVVQEQVREYDRKIVAARIAGDITKINEIQTERNEFVVNAITTANVQADIQKNGSVEEQYNLYVDRKAEGAEIKKEDEPVGEHKVVIKTKFAFETAVDLPAENIVTKTGIYKPEEDNANIEKKGGNISSDILARELVTRINVAHAAGKELSVEDALRQVLSNHKDKISLFNLTGAEALVKDIVDKGYEISQTEFDDAAEKQNQLQMKEIGTIMNTVATDLPSIEGITKSKWESEFDVIRNKAQKDPLFAVQFNLDTEISMSDEELALAYCVDIYGPETQSIFTAIARNDRRFINTPMLRKAAQVFSVVTQAMQRANVAYAEKMELAIRKEEKELLTKTQELLGKVTKTGSLLELQEGALKYASLTTIQERSEMEQSGEPYYDRQNPLGNVAQRGIATGSMYATPLQTRIAENIKDKDELADYQRVLGGTGNAFGFGVPLVKVRALMDVMGNNINNLTKKTQYVRGGKIYLPIYTEGLVSESDVALEENYKKFGKKVLSAQKIGDIVFGKSVSYPESLKEIYEEDTVLKSLYASGVELLINHEESALGKRRVNLSLILAAEKFRANVSFEKNDSVSKAISIARDSIVSDEEPKSIDEFLSTITPESLSQPEVLLKDLKNRLSNEEFDAEELGVLQNVFEKMAIPVEAAEGNIKKQKKVFGDTIDAPEVLGLKRLVTEIIGDKDSKVPGELEAYKAAEGQITYAHEMVSQKDIDRVSQAVIDTLIDLRGLGLSGKQRRELEKAYKDKGTVDRIVGDVLTGWAAAGMKVYKVTEPINEKAKRLIEQMNESQKESLEI